MPFTDIVGHERPLSVLRASLRHDRLAQAYLFYGEDRIGKRLVALRLAQAINCEGTSSTEDGGCGSCRSCRQIEARTHPDVFFIEPDQEQANPQIKIEQIRELEQQAVYRPLIGRRKIFLLDEADRLTIGAANALLKTLEEPTGLSLFLLVAGRPYSLPATVRSRCQGLRFAPPTREQCETALTTRRGVTRADARFLALVSAGRLGEALEADLAALRQQDAAMAQLVSPAVLQSVAALMNEAEALAKTDRAHEALEWLSQWIRDLVLVAVHADPASILHEDRLPRLGAVAKSVRVEVLLDLLSDIDRFQRAASRNLNLHLALEGVLLRLRDGLTTGQPAGVPEA